MKKIYEVEAAEGGYKVTNIETNEVVSEGHKTKKEALAKKKEFNQARKVATAEAKAQEEQAKEEAQVEIDRSDKVEKITKANYKANMARAGALKQILRESFDTTGGFPSHRYIQQTLGFNISTKAIIRHKRKVLQALGHDPMTPVPTTQTLPRVEKAKAPEEPAEAATEPEATEAVTEETPEAVAEPEALVQA